MKIKIQDRDDAIPEGSVAVLLAAGVVLVGVIISLFSVIWWPWPIFVGGPITVAGVWAWLEELNSSWGS